MHLVNILELWTKQKINLNYQDFLSMKNMEKIERFKSILKTIPFPYKKIIPEEKYLNEKIIHQMLELLFFENGPNFKNISCYSNEENKWRKSKIKFINNNQLKIILDGKFTTERGRINCSLRENTGEWRWLEFNLLYLIYKL